MAVGPLIQVELTRERDTLPSAGVQQYRLTVTNRDTVNTVRVRIQVPMTKYESARAFTSAGVGVASNTASGTAAIADNTVTLTAGGTSYVTYNINSTLTLPTGQTYGSSTLVPTVQVDQRPTSTGVTEPIVTRLITSFIGDRTVSKFGQRANDKNSYPDEVQIATYLVGKSNSEARAQALVDEIDRGALTPDAYETWRSINMLGGRWKVVSTTASYTVGADDGMVINVSGANTVTLPAANVADTGRMLIIKSTAGAITLAGGAVSNSVTSITAAKTLVVVSDGTTWNVVSVLA